MRRVTQLLTAGVGLVCVAIMVRWRLEQSAAIIPLPTNLGHLDPGVSGLIKTAAWRVQGEPRDAENWRELGMVYHANGIADLAHSCHEQAVQLDPLSARAWYHLSLIQTSLGQVAEGIESLKRVLKVEHGYAPAHWRLGMCYLEQGELDRAEGAFRSALLLDPQDPAAHVGLARVHLQRNENDRAVEILRALLERTVGDIANEGYVTQLLGLALNRSGHPQEAKVMLARSRRSGIKPMWSDPWADELGRYHSGVDAAISHATMLAASGRFEQALALLQGLRDQHPRETSVLLAMAVCYRDQKRFNEAFAALEDARNMSPDWPFVHANLAILSLMQSREYSGQRAATLRQQALAHVRRALALNPVLALSHGAHGDILLACGNIEGALQAYRTAALHDADPSQWLLRVGKAHVEGKQWELAIHTLERVTASSPHNSEAWYVLGLSLAQSGRMGEAQRALGKAVQLCPSDARYADSLHQMTSARLIGAKPSALEPKSWP